MSNQKNCFFSKAVPEEVSFGYCIYTPDNYDLKNESLPLIVFLHGAGERGNGTTQLDRVKIHGTPKMAERGDKMPRAVIVSPQCAEGKVWNTQVYQLKAFIDSIAEEYNIDKSKISLTGLSMGGYGTWMMATTFPGFFYKLAPVCGGGMPWLAGLIKVPVKAFHGTVDSVVPYHCSVDMVEAVNRNGGNAELISFEGVDHGSWVPAYEETDLNEWLVK